MNERVPGLESKDKKIARKSLVNEFYLARKAQNKSSRLQDSSHWEFAERDVDRLENKDPIGYGLNLGRVNCLNQLDELLGTEDAIKLREKLDERDSNKKTTNEEIIDDLSDKGFNVDSDEIQTVINNYLHFQRSIYKHQELKEDNNGNR